MRLRGFYDDRNDYDMVARTGLSTKDFIAPTSFDFRDSRYFRMGKTIGAVSFLQILAPELSDKMLADFLDMDNSIIVNLHVQSIDQAKAIKQIKTTVGSAGCIHCRMFQAYS